MIFIKIVFVVLLLTQKNVICKSIYSTKISGTIMWPQSKWAVFFLHSDFKYHKINKYMYRYPRTKICRFCCSDLLRRVSWGDYDTQKLGIKFIQVNTKELIEALIVQQIIQKKI